MSCHRLPILAAMAAVGMLSSFVWAAPGYQFSNFGGISNTRHNMTQSTAAGGINIFMDGSRNDYGEVCVYCHTPHGAQTIVRMPLWNRTIKATTYTTYDQLGTSTLNSTVSQPGNSSLTCLSCHDGQTAMDSIINMPGSGMGLGSQTTTQNTVFLNSWSGGSSSTNHQGFNSNNNTMGDGAGSQGCLVCHSTTGGLPGGANGDAADFTLFLIGTDLTNDHPIGVTFPINSGPGTDWNSPSGTKGTSRFFDTNANGKMDKEDPRTYNGLVECASCHDPHGVPNTANGNVFNPTFLRVANNNEGAGSALCLTCHNK